jgi:alpha-beta hydrolase superfamily lysophospholipase
VARTLGQRLRFLTFAFALIVLLTYGVGSFYLAWNTTAAHPGGITVSAESIGTDFESVSFSSRTDHIVLRGWLFHAPGFSGRSVVLVHGWQANRSTVSPEARDMIAHGYDALIFDTRGEGLSDGGHETLGSLEQRDVLGAYDYMKQRGYAAGKMTFYGQSQGAAAIIEAAPQMSDVGALISDSSFADLSALLAQRFTASTRLPGSLDLLGVTFARIFGVDPALRPVDVVAGLPHRAFLFFHATGDQFVPVASANELRSASTNPDSKLVLFAGTGHLDTYAADPSTYMADVYSFINSQVKS